MHRDLLEFTLKAETLTNQQFTERDGSGRYTWCRATVVAEDSVLWQWKWDCESVMVVLLTDQLVLVQKQSPVSSVRWPWSTLIHCADFHDEYDWFLFSISNVYLSNITKYLQVMSMSSFRFHHVLFSELYYYHCSFGEFNQTLDVFFVDWTLD